jgi:Tfp pilus assembly protein PilF
MTRTCRISLLVLSLILVLTQGAAEVAGAASPLAGKLIYLQGKVEVRRGQTEIWQAAQINQDLLAGDAVKTGPLSRAAILCVDESQVKLNEHTLLVIESTAPSPRLQPVTAPVAAPEAASSLYSVPQGEIWLRNKNQKFRFELKTPSVSAAIRGTEFNLRVAADGTTSLTLLEGSLRLANEYGALVLEPGEEGLARPGQAPTKRVLVQPADAVQWTLYYPGIFSYRDLPLASLEEGRAPQGPPAVAALLRDSEASYDKGELTQAQKGAESALQQDPQSSRALTILGWLSLQRHAPEEALEYFRRAPTPDGATVIGAALARYRLGDATGAYGLLLGARQKLNPTPLFLAMEGYFALLAGKVAEARALLETASRQAPTLMLPRALLAQIYVVQNRKDAAKNEAAQALSQAPGSPLAQLTMGLVEIAYFELPAARQYLEKARDADPHFIDAYVYLAKLWLGGDYLDRAWKTIEAALKLAPREGEVLALAGFIRLGYRDYRAAQGFFHQAIKASPALGEPHIGLAICHFRYREYNQGVAEMLAATLLEPRISSYQSELGKALYQVRAFDKSLEVYDYAKTLDPKDPTPYLYKGIALTDLNRPAEAVQEINRAIGLNDNKAVFRSRIMLDRDQAVNNYNLARAYNQLGLAEWAYSKAVTSAQQSPTSGAAYLFLNESYLATYNVGASNSSRILYYLLSPANQNTFTQAPNSATVDYIANDYTPMFEMPYWRAQLQGGIGAWKSDSLDQLHSFEAYGGWPGLALDAYGYYQNDQGFRNRNGGLVGYGLYNMAKWEPTVQHSLLAMYSHYDNKWGDNHNGSNYYDYDSPFGRNVNRASRYELGYVYRFNPNATFLAYYNYYVNDFRYNNIIRSNGQLDAYLFSDQYLYSGYIDYNKVSHYSELFPTETQNVQFQQQFIVGDHTFMGGFDYYTGHYKYRYQETTQTLYTYYHNLFTTLLIPPFSTSSDPFTMTLNQLNIYSIYQAFRPPARSYTFYLLDYWKISRNLLIELGLFQDIVKSPRWGFAEPIYQNKRSPRLGVNYMVTDSHTLRLALQESVNSHYSRSPTSLVPPTVAGFPWQVNTSSGDLVREAGLSWEAQWNAKTFSVVRMDALRADHPHYDVDSNGKTRRDQHMYHRYQISFTLNRILGQYYGLSLGALAKKFDPTWQTSYDYKEFNAFAKLVFWHPSGWWAWINPLLVKQDLTDPTLRGGNLFGLLNASIGYQFPGKRGVASLEVDNVFNRHFNYTVDPSNLYVPNFFNSQRWIMFKVALFI